MTGEPTNECRCLLVRPERIPDEMLWSMVMNNDGDAFKVILDRYIRLVRRIAWKFLRDNDEVDEVTQTIFLDLFRARYQFDIHKGPFKVWLMRYAYTRSINHLEWLKRHRLYTQPSIDDHGRENRLTKRIWARELLTHLSPLQQRAVRLVCMADFTLPEAARAMKRTLAATRNYCYRGLAKLRAMELLGGGR